jgi:hypothetical protein
VAANDHFVALSECHFMNPESMEEISYYPGYEQSVEGAGTTFRVVLPSIPHDRRN